ncbi:hypothetical protein D9758_001789 [Tetrapyrgos nigripes]|uniref:Superkiller protein 3 n=1 Tax=Tetrapyrgos nigripes TaxID=182062 RepID=A0A8H5GXU0_9AGAR|nr:hypothetical protein D9758_001789 [Tetrapyrgos nigripes]
MSIVKTKLKSARDHLGKKNYDAAKDAALQVLDFEPDNYNANVFLGLASLELGELDESEKAYRRATDLNPDQLLAWQGLSQFYEKKADWESYADVLLRLMKMHAQSQDAVKCAETLQKYIDLRRKSSSAGQLVEALSFLLPSSPFYDLLATLPPPDPTSPASTTTFNIQSSIHNTLTVLEELVSIVERQEEESFKKEVDKRRLRLGAPGLEQIRNEVGREIWGSSPLPDYYNEILNHPDTSDLLRRETESKLLKFKERHLSSLPATEESSSLKSKIGQEVTELVSGIVLLKIPNELAWTLFIESKDVEHTYEYDYGLLRQFIALCPSSHLASIIRGFFMYMQISLSEDQDEEEEEGKEQAPQTPEDPDLGYDIIMEAYKFIPNSVLANRILGEVQLKELEYASAVQTAQSSLHLLNKMESNIGKTLPRVRLAFNVILATSLVDLFPPKHHRRALGIINEILTVSPDSISGLMGRAYILQASYQWREAGNLFARVHTLLPDDLKDGLRAKEEHAWCQIKTRDFSDGTRRLGEVLEALGSSEERSHDRARCHWRLGQAFWDSDGKHEDAYKNFIIALKCDSTFAPAFTSLGIYYTEIAQDPARASKCFQKAFELDSREAEAAYRLVKGFADEQEWDLVEIVARRTIEGEGGLEGGMAANSTEKFSPTHTWAWKALGIVNFIRRDYVSAISAFQVALRAEPDDWLTWLRLGEAYFKSGRQSAALKALGRAKVLRPDDWICGFFIAEVHRQLGQFEDAISQLDSIMTAKPSEICVIASLAQTYLDLGCSERTTGFTARAQKSWISALSLASSAIKHSTGFRSVIWKIAADAVFHLSTLATLSDESSLRDVLIGLRDIFPATPSDRLSGLISPSSQLLDRISSRNDLLELAIFLYDHRASLGSSENTAVGSAWYDLAVSLRRLAAALPSSDRQADIEKQAVKSLIEAIRNLPNNADYWIALGDAYFTSQPRMAQHAYVKALEINSKSAATWTNLGLLYLHHQDHELANEAFYRAQSADPDYTLAWVGQALIAIGQGHVAGATGILAHAPEADYQYAAKIFDRRQKSSIPLMQHLMPAFFVLDRYCKASSNDPSALHLYGLVCEALGQVELGVELINKAVSILESAYEETEDAEIERQFTIAHSNIGRLQLSLGDCDSALASFDTVLGLLPENIEGEVQCSLLRTHAQFSAGLAHFRQGHLENALEMLEASLESAEDEEVKGQVQVLLAQVLWAIGTDDFKEQAKTKLLECISSNPENLTAINVLAAMGILTDDDSLVDAALSEILSLPIDRRLELDPQRNVDHLLVQHHLGQDDLTKAISVAQQAIFFRSYVARDPKPYSSVLPLLSSHVTDSENLADAGHNVNLQAVAETLAPSEEPKSLYFAQKGIMLRPSDPEGWIALALARGQV